MDLTILYFVVMGLIGGITHVVVIAENWSDLKKFSAFKRSILGAICGLIYFFLHIEHDFPNMVMTFVVGYSGTSFINNLISQYRKQKSKI